MKRILFSALILITTLLVVFTACACGKNKGGNENVENEEAAKCNHEWSVVNSRLPLCSENGYALYRCNHCNEEKTITSSGCVYRYEFTLNGESCEDGFDSKKICTICGETSNATFSNHVLFEAASYELCGGEMAVISKCPCGEYGKADYKKCVGTGWSEGDEAEVTDEETGIVHTINEYWCTSCGFSIKVDRYQETEGCYTYTRELGQALDSEGKVVVEYFNPSFDVEANHDLAYSYKDFEGKTSCEDGYTVVEACRECEYTNEYTYDAHDLMYLSETVDFTEYNACGGQIKVISCPCGENKRATLNVCPDAKIELTPPKTEGTDEIEETFYICDECGLVVTRTIKKTAVQVIEEYTAVINGEEIYTVGYVYDTTK